MSECTSVDLRWQIPGRLSGNWVSSLHHRSASQFWFQTWRAWTGSWKLEEKLGGWMKFPCLLQLVRDSPLRTPTAPSRNHCPILARSAKWLNAKDWKYAAISVVWPFAPLTEGSIPRLLAVSLNASLTLAVMKYPWETRLAQLPQVRKDNWHGQSAKCLHRRHWMFIELLAEINSARKACNPLSWYVWPGLGKYLAILGSKTQRERVGWTRRI